MANKIYLMDVEDEPDVKLACFTCPGCGYGHSPNIGQTSKHYGSAWGFNGDLEKPTFTPSILVWQSRPEARCHSFVTDGRIQFLSDCFHHLAGQTVDLPDWED